VDGSGIEGVDDFRFRRRFPAVESPPLMKNRLVLLFACFVSCVRAEPEAVEAIEVAADAPDFIRVEDSDTATALQTAVVRYTKGEASVELVGAIHIADKKYYEALNRRFEGYEALLYEGVGDPPAADPGLGEVVEPPAVEVPLEEAPGADLPAAKVPAKKEKLDGLHTAYESGAKWLGLAYQMKEIDYRKANFVHADLSMAEFTALQKERGESLLGFVLKSGLRKSAKPVKEPSTLKLLTSLVRGDKSGLKRELVHTLGAGDDQMAALAGDNVIIGDRNAKCLEVLDRELLAGKKKLGIFYGAAHFPDLERRLLEDGWEKAGEEWMTAWDIPKTGK
jgi:hypothetical protein